MGFYADIEANCKVYHTCDDHGNKFTYRCPEETAFRQDALICDHAHLVDCQTTVYPPSRFPNENVDKNNVTLTIRSPITPSDSFDDHRLSFSRSFQVIQRPDKSVPNKLQPGFVFSASLFLKDRDQTRGRSAQQIADGRRICNVDSNRMPASAVRTERFDYWNTRKDKPSPPRQLQSLSLPEPRVPAPAKSAVYLRRSFEPTASPPPARAIVLGLTQRPPPPHERSSLMSHDYRPYSETLRSIQANAARTTSVQSVKSTTEIPVHALTLSLKPLVPNELEYDPYYPKQPTSTEAYYTPSDANTRSFSSGQTPLSTVARFNLPFEIPSVLPDLNGLEDLIDRRKFFYIPRVNVESMTH